jgi:precorrin-6B methylase 2
MADYALTLSPVEVARYQGMARAAIASELPDFVAAGIVDGAVVADVGCGPGALSVELGRLVGPTGTVLAVDRDPGALAVADRLVAAAGLDNVTTSEGDAAATGLAAGSVDVVMLRHVLAHNGGREQAIVDHLGSLVRPGGTVYLLDIEATGIRVRPADGLEELAELQERYRQFQTDRGNDLSVGLRLAELLAAAGLEVAAHRGWYQIMQFLPGMRPPAWAAREEMRAAGLVDDEDIARWELGFTRLAEAATQPTMFIPLFLGVGRRPR